MADVRRCIDAEMESIEGILSELPCAESLDDLSTLELAGVCSFLHNYYNGMENILKQCLKGRGQELPSGATWHRDLLDKAEEQGIVSRSTAERLVPFLGFRHFFAHGYAVEVDPGKVESLVRVAREVLAEFKRDVNHSFPCSH